MALNFAGLGFSFGAQDAGFNKQADRATAAIDGIGKAVKRTDDIARSNKLGLLAHSFEMIKLNNIDSQLDRLNESLGNFGSEGTRSLDQMSDATARMRANFVLSGEEGVKASQMITRTVGVAGGTIEEVSSAARAFTAVFSPSEINSRFGHFFKLTKLGGVNAEEFAGQIANFEKSWSETGESSAIIEGRTASMIDQIVAVGSSVGQADIALQSLPMVIKQIDESASMFRESLSPEMFKKAVVGTTGLAAAMQRNGVRMADGIPSALKLFSAFAEGRLQMDKLKTGLGGNVDALKEWGVAGIDLESAFDLMKKDPLAAAQSLATLRQRIVDNHGEVFRFDNAMNEVAPDVMMLFKSLGKDAEKVLGQVIPGAIAHSEGAAQNFTTQMMKSGVIQQEILERSQESFKRTMGSIAMDFMPGARKSIAANFRKSSEVIKDFVKKGGPLGRLTGHLIAVKEQGFGALFAGMGPVLGMFGEMAMSTLPVITAMGAMGLHFGTLGKLITGPLSMIGSLGTALFALTGPFGVVIALLGGLGAAFALAGTEGGSKFIDTLKGLGEKGGSMLLKGLYSIAPELTQSIGKFFGVAPPDMRELFKIPKSGIISEKERARLRKNFQIDLPEGVISPEARAQIDKVNERLGNKNKASVQGFVKSTIDAFDFGLVWEKVKGKLVKVFESVNASDIAGFVTKGVELVQKAAVAIINGLVKGFSGEDSKSRVMTAGMALNDPLADAFGKMIANVGIGVGTALKGVFSKAFDGVTDETKTWGERLSGLVVPGLLGAFAIAKFSGPLGSLVGLFGSAFGKIYDGAAKLGSKLMEVDWSKFATRMKENAEAVSSFGKRLVNEGIPNAWKYAKNLSKSAWEGMKSFGSAMKRGALASWEFVKNLGPAMKSAALSTWNFAKSAAASSWNFVKNLGPAMKSAALSAWSFGKAMIVTGATAVMSFARMAASAVASMIRVAISFAPVVIALAAFGALVGIVFAIGSNAMKAFGDDSLDTMGKIEAVGEGALKDILGFTFGMFGVAREETDMFVDWLGFAIGDAMNSAWGSISRLGEDIGVWISDLITDFGLFSKSVVASFGTIGDTAGSILTNIKDLVTGKVTVGQLFEKAGKERFKEIDKERDTILKKRQKDATALTEERLGEDRTVERARDVLADEMYEKRRKLEAQQAAARSAEEKKKKTEKVPGETMAVPDASSLLDTVMGKVKSGAGQLGEMLGITAPEAPVVGTKGKRVTEEGFDFSDAAMPAFDTAGFDFAAPETAAMPSMETSSPGGAESAGAAREPAAVRFAPEELNTLRAQTAAAQAQVTGMQELTGVMRSMQQAIEMLVASNTKRPAMAGPSRAQVDVNFRGDASKLLEKRSQRAIGGTGIPLALGGT